MDSFPHASLADVIASGGFVSEKAMRLLALYVDKESFCRLFRMSRRSSSVVAHVSSDNAWI